MLPMTMTTQKCAAALVLAFVILAIGCAKSAEPRQPLPVQSIAPVSSAEENCPVHGDRLLNGEVRVVYGYLPREFSSEYRRAKHDLFPCANTYSWGGCDYEADADPESKQVLYCPDCRKAHETWSKVHHPVPEGLTELFLRQ